jgi:GTP-binding protein
MFIDEAKIELISGTGGAGAVSFHREKHVPRGGPNGADGGKGGDVILVADRSKRTLFDFRRISQYQAEIGTTAHGNKNGKNGKDIVLKVPVGTLVFNDLTGELIVDLCAHEMQYRICKGGRGGFGNLYYVSSSRQVPKIAEMGEPGESIHARLELKLLADVGLIGLPNAGKSTLLSRISAAKPKIADYPFTTIVPNLGVVQIGDSTFTVADMPGLIENASSGVGLGHQFLKHIERTKILVHVIDVWPIEESDPVENYEIIENELKEYSRELFGKPRIVVLNKIDVYPQDELKLLIQKFEGAGVHVATISAASGAGIKELLYLIEGKLIESESQVVEYIVPTVQAPKNLDNSWHIESTETEVVVLGKNVERIVAMTNLHNPDALRHLHRRLEKMGVYEGLRRLDLADGQLVRIGKFEFEYSEDL